MEPNVYLTSIFLMRRKQLILVVVFIILIVMYYTSGQFRSSGSTTSQLYLNYFLDGDDDRLKLGFIINTPTCRIMNISAWDKSISPFLSSASPPIDCKGTGAREWTYIENNSIIINVTDLHEAGYSLSSVSCCYQAIERVQQSPIRYDRKADLQIKYSKTCMPMMSVTTPSEDEFIRVQCSSKYWPWLSDPVYRSFHAMPLLTKNQKTMDKMLYWQAKVNKADNNISSASSTNSLPPSSDFQKTEKILDKHNAQIRVPPNVLLLGLDSMSRLNFHRYMRKTREYLQQIGAVEMQGYTKVGENTFPNVVAFMSGYHEDDLVKICYFSRATKQDLCPYLWKKFGEANYLTALIEDGNTFNYWKTGFVEQPTDYYFRPFILGMRAHSYINGIDALDCVGRKRMVNIFHKYISDTLMFPKRNNTPVFILSWLTNLAHDDMNAPQFADSTHVEFLQKLDLSNTILFFLSDHGTRYGVVRETFAGWMEDKLPTFWVYLPENIRRRFPTWLPSLQRNSVLSSLMYRRFSLQLQTYHVYFAGEAI